jgi:hypothetical protein
LEKALYRGGQQPASAPTTTSTIKEDAEIPLHVVEPPVVPLIPLHEDQIQEQPKISAFEAKLHQLEEMGFCDRSKNTQLLVKCNGDMVTVVRLLLE